MDEKGHTPGPWYTSKDAVPEWHVQVTVSSEETGERVATVFQTEANAQLIAAAPDLLAVAQTLLSEADSTGGHTRTVSRLSVDHLRAVIAKATGQES